MEGPRLVKHPPCTIITHGIAPGHYQSTIAQQSLYINACSLLSHFASGHHTFVCGGTIALLLVSCSCCIHNRQATLCCHYIHNLHTRPAVILLLPFPTAMCYRHLVLLFAFAICYCYLLLLLAIAICYILYLLLLFAICRCCMHTPIQSPMWYIAG